MSENYTAKTERDIYVILVCDKLKKIYNEMLHITPVIDASDAEKIFNGDVELYEKHKEEIFKQLKLDEAGIMNFGELKPTTKKLGRKKKKRDGRKN